MHNTLTVDGRQQSIPASSFHWRSRANASMRLWRTGHGFDVVEGEHDGYAPHLHRRAVVRDGSGLWLIADHYLGRGDSRLDLRWHLESAWRVVRAESGAAILRHNDGHEAGLASTGSTLSHGAGGAFGWQAPVYGQHEPGLTIEIAETGPAPHSIVTAVVGGNAVRGLSVEPLRVCSDRVDAWHRTAVLGHYPAGRFIAIFSTELPDAAEIEMKSLQTVDTCGHEFHTDARIAVLCLSSLFEPTSLTLIDGSQAAWTGPRGFRLDRSPAADLHLDRSALARLSDRQQPARSAVGAGAVRTICAE
jgi:hypothetical protein